MIQVKIFDEEHEEDLQNVINEFLKNHRYIDIQYQCSVCGNSEEQIYCFSAMIVYENDE